MATHMDERTDPKVYSILEHVRITGDRIRIWYGDTETGKDWMEEDDVIGTIGRSTGTAKIPLLIRNKRSMGGTGILTSCIVKITINKKVVYQHPKYIEPKFAIQYNPEEKYRYSVLVSNEKHVNFLTMKQAENWVAFMLGHRNNK